MRLLLSTLCLVLLISMPSVSQIGTKVQQANSIFGTWENTQYGYRMTLLLQPDGNGSFDGEALTFLVKSNQLSVSQAGLVNNYTYSLDGNTLRLTGGDLEETVAFTRSGSAATDGVTQSMNNNTTSATGLLSSGNTPSNDINGSWSGSGETIEFKSNGQCSYLGQTFPYKISQGQVTLTAADGEHVFSYTVTGNQLTLSANQSSVTYTKNAASSNTNQQGTSTGGGMVDQTLVSKWCYADVNSYNSGASSSSTCVTLNADGTYEYYGESSRSVNTTDFSGGTSSQQSDRGTWYVQGNRIYFNSQSQGQLSYLLEKRNHPKNTNDPMIVLDGKTFVCAYNMPPWR